MGPYRLAQEVGSIYVDRVLEAHPLGHQTLGCVWLLAFAILRTTAEQLDFAFNIFDPIESSSYVSYTLGRPLLALADLEQTSSVPGLNEIPNILEKSNRLARIDRYLSGLEEFLSFFLSVRQHLPVQQRPVMDVDAPAFRTVEVTNSASLEAVRAHEKIQQEQRLCRTYMRQYDTLVQLVSCIPQSELQTRPNASTGHIVQRYSDHRTSRFWTKTWRAICQDRNVPRCPCRYCSAIELVNWILWHERAGTCSRHFRHAFRVLADWHTSPAAHNQLHRQLCYLDDKKYRARP